MRPRSPDAARDMEARVRALTREVGTLREDLRREVKRRERAVVQSKEHEQVRVGVEAQLQELLYANRKLTGELDAAHAAARAAADRDRRSLRSLRDGLAEVEATVVGRAQGGAQQARLAMDQLHLLRDVLFPPAAPSTISFTAAAATAREILLTTDVLLTQVHDVLTGGQAPVPAALRSATAADLAAADLAAQQRAGSAGAEADAGSSGAGGGQGQPPFSVAAMTAGVHPAVAAAAEAVAGAPAFDMEKEQLKDEVVRLRAEMRSLADASLGASAFASRDLHEALGASRAELARVQAEEERLKSSLQQSHQNMEQLRQEVVALRGRLQAQDSGAASLLNLTQQKEANSQARITDLESNRAMLSEQVNQLQRQVEASTAAVDSLRHENASLSQQLTATQWKLSEQAAKAAKLQGNMSMQHADLRSALDLIASSHRQTAIASTTAVTNHADAYPNSSHALHLPSSSASFLTNGGAPYRDGVGQTISFMPSSSAPYREAYLQRSAADYAAPDTAWQALHSTVSSPSRQPHLGQRHTMGANYVLDPHWPPPTHVTSSVPPLNSSALPPQEASGSLAGYSHLLAAYPTAHGVQSAEAQHTLAGYTPAAAAAAQSSSLQHHQQREQQREMTAATGAVTSAAAAAVAQALALVRGNHAHPPPTSLMQVNATSGPLGFAHKADSGHRPAIPGPWQQQQSASLQAESESSRQTQHPHIGSSLQNPSYQHHNPPRGDSAVHANSDARAGVESVLTARTSHRTGGGDIAAGQDALRIQRHVSTLSSQNQALLHPSSGARTAGTSQRMPLHQVHHVAQATPEAEEKRRLSEPLAVIQSKSAGKQNREREKATRKGSGSGARQLQQLKQDMASLDDEFLTLEASMQSAAARFAL